MNRSPRTPPACFIEIDLSIPGERWDDGENWNGLARRIVDAAMAQLDQGWSGTKELSLVLADDAFVRRLNAQWRERDRATNVLSFPAIALKAGVEPGPMLGDIVIAHETVSREAASMGKNLSAHFSHLVLHGFLHLLGYDHEDDTMAHEMEGLEIRILASLGLSDPYVPADELLSKAHFVTAS